MRGGKYGIECEKKVPVGARRKVRHRVRDEQATAHQPGTFIFCYSTKAIYKYTLTATITYRNVQADAQEGLRVTDARARVAVALVGARRKVRHRVREKEAARRVEADDTLQAREQNIHAGKRSMFHTFYVHLLNWNTNSSGAEQKYPASGAARGS